MTAPQTMLSATRVDGAVRAPPGGQTPMLYRDAALRNAAAISTDVEARHSGDVRLLNLARYEDDA